MKYDLHTPRDVITVEASDAWEALMIVSRADVVVVEQLPDGQFEAARYLPDFDAFVSCRDVSRGEAIAKAFFHYFRTDFGKSEGEPCSEK